MGIRPSQVIERVIRAFKLVYGVLYYLALV